MGNERTWVAVHSAFRIPHGALFLGWAVLASPPASLAQDLPSRDRVVRSVSFQGNRVIDDYTLRMSIATSQSSWQQRTPLLRWTGFGDKRYFDETEFRRDVLRLGLLYRQSGFFESRIDTVVVRDSASVQVEFLITEGEPVRISGMWVTGADHIMAPGELLAYLPLRERDPFNRYRLQASVDSIRSALQNRGYPYADVFRNYDENRARHEARVWFAVDPGPRARIGSIEVIGTSQIDPAVVRRSAGLHAGDLYRKDALARTQIQLYRTDLFSHVNVGLADSTTFAVPADTLVPVRVGVTEGKPYGARAGAGYGLQDCIRGLTGLTARDFLGGGRSLDLTARISKIGTRAVGTTFPCPGLQSETDSTRLKPNYNVTVSLRQPAFLSYRTSAVFSVFAERRSELNTFVRTAQGAEVSLGQEIAWQTALSLSYGLSYGQTEADPAIFCVLQNVCSVDDAAFTGARRESAIGLSVNHDASNSPLDPSRGRALSIQTRYAAPGIGSDSLSQFAKGVFDFASYHRLGRRGVFAWRVRLGWIVPTELGFSTQRARWVPPDERLYAGGPNTVRGYGQNELGPLVRVQVVTRDSLGNPVRNPNGTPQDSTMRSSPTGGTRLVVGNVEMRVPLPVFAGRLWGAVFVDAGQVFDPDRPITERQPRVTPGLGLRLGTPLGPVRVDLAYRPYEPTASPLYEAANGQLTEIRSSYAPPTPTREWDRFWSRVRISISVGQAF